MDEATAKILLVVVGAALTSIPLFPLVLWRLASIERRRGEEKAEAEKRIEAGEKRLESAIEDLRKAIKGLGEQLAPAAGHGFSIAAHAEALRNLDHESRRARVKLHRMDTGMQKVVLLLQLIRKGLHIPDSAVESLTHDFQEPPPSGEGEDT